MCLAYKYGRAENDPSKRWYASEIGFFDFYIIPLAKKLKDCGVFGVSSDELSGVIVDWEMCIWNLPSLTHSFSTNLLHNQYLQYAKQNRKEWEDKGKEIVAEMVESFGNRFGNMIEV